MIDGDETDVIGPQRTTNAGVERPDEECGSLGAHDIDAHQAGSDIVIANRDEGAAMAAPHNAVTAKRHDQGDREAKKIERGIAGEFDTEKLRRLKRKTVRSAEPRLRKIEDEEWNSICAAIVVSAR